MMCLWTNFAHKRRHKNRIEILCRSYKIFSNNEYVTGNKSPTRSQCFSTTFSFKSNRLSCLVVIKGGPTGLVIMS